MKTLTDPFSKNWISESKCNCSIKVEKSTLAKKVFGKSQNCKLVTSILLSPHLKSNKIVDSHPRHHLGTVGWDILFSERTAAKAPTPVFTQSFSLPTFDPWGIISKSISSEFDEETFSVSWDLETETFWKKFKSNFHQFNFEFQVHFCVPWLMLILWCWQKEI